MHVNQRKNARYSDLYLSLFYLGTSCLLFTVFFSFADFITLFFFFFSFHFGVTSAFDLSHHSGSLPNNLLYVWTVENKFVVTV